MKILPFGLSCARPEYVEGSKALQSFMGTPATELKKHPFGLSLSKPLPTVPHLPCNTPHGDTMRGWHRGRL
jgi:hypothetical protein